MSIRIIFWTLGGVFIAIWTHRQSSVGGYLKIVLSRYMKNGKSDTPLS